VSQEVFQVLQREGESKLDGKVQVPCVWISQDDGMSERKRINAHLEERDLSRKGARATDH
jgi:hypothetical protein